MKFSVSTTSTSEWIDITRTVQATVSKAGLANGWCLISVPHTTAGITINESADPAVAADVQATLNRLVPDRADYRHLEGNSAAHVKTTLVGSSVTVPVEDGRLVLGTWQGIFFCEFDGPRSRKVHVSVTSIG